MVLNRHLSLFSLDLRLIMVDTFYHYLTCFLLQTIYDIVQIHHMMDPIHHMMYPVHHMMDRGVHYMMDRVHHMMDGVHHMMDTFFWQIRYISGF